MVNLSIFHLSSFGGIPWTDLPIVIEDIDRIEVIRGPNAATYGPNSFMAVINIITKHTAQDQGVQASYRAGTRDYHRGMLRYGSTSDPVRTERHSSFSQLLRWEHQVDNDQSIATQFSFRQQRVDEDFISDNINIKNDQLSERIDFEIEHVFVPFEQAWMIWGVGVRRDRFRLPFYISDNDDKTNMQYRVFGNLEWRFLDQFTLNLGALFERNSYTDPDISPRLALNYHFTKQQTLRFAVPRTSRIPVLGEEHLDILQAIPSLIPVLGKSPNDLEAETAITFDVGYLGRFLEDKLLVDMKVSRQRFRHLINIPDFTLNDNKQPVFRYDNDNTATMLSYELQLGYRPTRATLFHFGYSYVNIPVVLINPLN